MNWHNNKKRISFMKWEPKFPQTLQNLEVNKEMRKIIERLEYRNYLK